MTGSTSYPNRPFTAESLASWLAAYSVPTEDLSQLKQAILVELVKVHPEGLTDDELSNRLKRYRYTVAPRRLWLTRAGLVEAKRWPTTLAPVLRRGPRGRLQTVWKLVMSPTYTKPRATRASKKVDALLLARRYAKALREIELVHCRVVRQTMGELGEFDEALCEACSQPWPCETRQILNEARIKKENDR